MIITVTVERIAEVKNKEAQLLGYSIRMTRTDLSICPPEVSSQGAISLFVPASVPVPWTPGQPLEITI